MRISYWSSDVCSSDLRHLPPLRRKRVLRGNQLVDRLAHVPPTLQVPGELFDELLAPRPAMRPRSFRVRLRDWRYHGQVVAHAQRQRLAPARLVAIQTFEMQGPLVEPPRHRALLLVLVIGGASCRGRVGWEG